MNLRFLSGMVSRDRIVRLVLVALVIAVVIALLVTPKPWDFPAPDGGKIRIRDFAGIYSWWAALINLVPLILLAATTRFWLRPLQRQASRLSAVPVSGSRMFWGVVLAAMLACAVMNAPRLGHSLWDDEEYSVRRVILGSYQRKNEGDLKLKEVRWSETFWYYSKPNNHFLNSILSRLSNSTWRALTRPQGLQFSETALRLPAFLAGTFAVGVWAQLLARCGFPSAGMIAAWLIALHPWYMRFLPQTRGYALVFLFLPLACLLALEAVRDGRWRFWMASAAAQFALFYSWPGMTLTLVVLNLGLGGLLLFQGNDRTVLTVRWLVSTGVAGMIAIQLTLPCLAQLQHHLDAWDSSALGLPWMQNVGALLLTGLPWRNAAAAFPDLQTAASAHPVAVAVLFCVGVSGILLGALRLGFSRRPGAFLLPVLVLPGPAAYLFALWKDTHLFEWYMVFMVPGLLALMAVGLCFALTPLARRHQFLAATGAVAWLVFFGVLTHPARSEYIHHPVQLLRESVLLTRPVLDPYDPRNQAIRTVTTLASPEIYDPNIRMVKSGPELKKILREADKAGLPVFVNQGYSSLLSGKSPELAALIFDPSLFEKITTLPGFEPFLDRDVYRYRAGSLPADP